MTEKAYVDVVACAYWDVLGRAMDRQGGENFVAQLEAGMSPEELLAELSSSDEGTERAAQLKAASVFVQGDVEIPFELDVRSGSKRLIVGFPGLGTAASPPSPRARQTASNLGHALTLGMGALPPTSSREVLDWAQAAAQLMAETAQGLELPLAQVWGFGHSFAGSKALLAGLTGGIGHIVTGAPALRMGMWIERLYEGTRDHAASRPLFDFHYHGSGIEAAPSEKQLIDDLVIDLAMRCPQPVTWSVLTSRTDICYDEAHEVAGEVLRRAPNVSVVLKEVDFADHNVVEPYLEAFLREQLVSSARELLPPDARKMTP